MAQPLETIVTDETLPPRADVVVIGGGIVGVGAALTLARQGVSILLCEKGRLAGEQSSRNWGWVRKTNRDMREVPLIIESFRLWNEMTREGIDTGYTECGILYIDENDADRERHERWLALVEPFQIGSRIIEGETLAEKLSGTTRRFKSAIFTPTDGRAEPQKAVTAMATAARSAGAVIVQNCAVRGLDLRAGRVAGVVTERGRVGCDSVILASGAWSRLFCGSLGLRLPQLKVWASVLRTAPIESGPETSAWLGDFGYRKRQDGGYTIGHGRGNVVPLVPDSFRFFREFLPAMRADQRGIRPRLTERFLKEAMTPRRWALDRPSPFERDRTLDPDPVLSINRAAINAAAATFPVFRDLKVVQEWGGLIDVTPDVVPVISEVETIPGLVIATGFSGHGFGIGPAAGRLAAEIATGRPTVVDAKPFRFSRFTDGSPIVIEPGM